MTRPDKHLLVILRGQQIGDLTQDRHGRLAFTYRDSWRRDPNATPLSLSMPLVTAEHGNQVVDAFLRGLLPDNDNVLQRWGARFGVSANSPFALLSYVGEDVAGAAAFVRPTRAQDAVDAGELMWIDEQDVAGRLQGLRGDRAAWDDVRFPGLFSLAGAQAKFALYRSPDGRWAIPTGRHATTHIVKPPLEHLAHQEVNEHLCLRAAARLGMRTARSDVMTFGDERAIVLARYDRVVHSDGRVERIHQEDACQALGVHPARKYERTDHGPGATRIIAEVLQARQDVPTGRASAEQMIRALAFNWVVYGPDAHAKNYSLLLSGDQVVLAPLYDVSSVLPYPDRVDLPTMAMAMSVNRKFQNDLITGDDWVALGAAVSVDGASVLDWVRDVVENAPQAFLDVAGEQQGWIRELPITTALVDGVATSSADRMRFLEPATPRAPRGRTVGRGHRPTTSIAPYERRDGSWVGGHTRARPEGP